MCVAGRAAKNHSWRLLPGNKRRTEAVCSRLYRCVLQYMRCFSAGVEMQSKREWMMGSVLFVAALLLVLLPSGARLNAKQFAVQSEDPVPAYHAQPPTEPLPKTMSPTQFDNPLGKNAYALAATVRKALYHQPS